VAQMVKSATIDPGTRIAGTRITIYDVLTYADVGWHPSSVAAMLGLQAATSRTG